MQVPEWLFREKFVATSPLKWINKFHSFWVIQIIKIHIYFQDVSAQIAVWTLTPVILMSELRGVGAARHQPPNPHPPKKNL